MDALTSMLHQLQDNLQQLHHSIQQAHHLEMQQSQGNSMLRRATAGSSLLLLPPLSSFTRFSRLPIELQLMIWELALPRRTVHIDASEVLRCRFLVSLHLQPKIAQVNRAARAVVLRTGRWLWISRDVPTLLPLKDALSSSLSSSTSPAWQVKDNGIDNDTIKKAKGNVLWFDAAHDTLLMSNMILWPQDVEVNPVSLEVDFGVKHIEGASTTGLHIEPNRQRLPYLSSFNSRPNIPDITFWMLPQPTLGHADPADKDAAAAAERKYVFDLRQWPDPKALLYTDSDDLSITLTRPLDRPAYAEFFPEGSTACFVDLSSLEYSSPATEESLVTVRKLQRLLRLWALTQDLADKMPIMRLLNDLATKPAKREALFARKRNALMFKWLRINWMVVSRAERESAEIQSAARCTCCNSAAGDTSSSSSSSSSSPSSSPSSSLSSSPSSSASTPTSTKSSWLSSYSSSSPPPGTWSQQHPSTPSIIYRMPRPYAAAFACPREFDLEHPWSKEALETMPRFRLGLLVKLEGRAAAAAVAPSASMRARVIARAIEGGRTGRLGEGVESRTTFRDRGA